MEKLQNRKPTRLKNFDYSKTGAYFLTICTKDRKNILSRIIVGGDVLDAPHIELKIHGIVADRIINQMNDYYDGIVVDKYVIMPDHIHLLLLIENGASGTSPPTVKQHSKVSRFVSTFKRFCNKEYGENIWQTSFYDHIIRNRDDYNEHVKYISDNPMRWYYKHMTHETFE